jgi:ABC-type multidrug transport system fused ATPase/permease subunit
MFATASKCLSLLDRPARRWLVVLIVIAVAVSAAEIMSAVLLISVLRPLTEPDAAMSVPGFGEFSDRFPDTSAQTLYTAMVALVGVFFILRGLLYVTQTYLQQRTSQTLGLRLSQCLVSGYFRQPYAFHLTRNSAELIRKSLQSATTVGSTILLSYVTLFSETLMVLGLLALLLANAPVPTLLLVSVLGPVIYLVTHGMNKRLTTLGKKNLTHYKVSLQSLTQSLEMMREIRVAGREAHFEQSFSTARTQYSRNSITGSTLSEVPRATLETILILTILGFLAVSNVGGGAASSSVSTLALLGYTTLRILPALSRIVAGLNRIRLSSAALDDVHEDLAAVRHAAVAPAPTDQTSIEFCEELAVQGVGYRYTGGARDVLSDVTLRVAAGESVGLVGPTGSGKSTLMDIVLGLLEPTQGRVTADGIDVHRHPSAWQKNIGLVPQSIVLLDDTLRRNIAFGMRDDEIDEQRVLDAVHLAQLDEVLSVLDHGLETVLGERGVRLSGGQRQRVGIARALYRDARVLLFDEGTSSLDTITEREILGALDRLHGQRTMLTIAHRLATVRACDRIYVLNHGHITDVGTYDELLQKSPQFRQMAR